MDKKTEALKLALEALEKIATVNAMDYEYQRWAKEHLAVIKEALAQPEQEPVTWVLTSEYNDYDQHGEYFEAVFIGKPTSEQIQKHCHVNKEGVGHILSGGGRMKDEYKWYYLRKTKAAHGKE